MNSQRLILSQQTLRDGVKKHLNGGMPFSGSRPMTNLQVENPRLRKESAETRLESKNLKKTVEYLGKEPRGAAR